MTHQIKACGNRISSSIRDGIYLAVVFCVVFFFAIPAFADPIPRLSDQKFQKELVEMTAEHDSDVTLRQAEKNPYIYERLIVKSYDGTLDPEDYGAVGAVRDRKGHYILQFDSSMAARRAQQKLEKEASVLYVEPDIPVFAQVETGSSQEMPFNWGTKYTKSDAYADYIGSASVSRSVRIAVLDSGIRHSHAYFEGRIDSSHEYDYVNTDNVASDDYGHGTQVAGIIAENTPGLNQIKIVPVKVLNSKGNGSLAVTCTAIQKLVSSQSADILNLSFVVPDIEELNELVNEKPKENPQFLKEQIRSATNAGMVVVVAAGNQGDDTVNHPPADTKDDEASGCIIVSYCNSNGIPSSLSNYGDSVDLCAPGVGVDTANNTDDTAIKTVNGSSFAAPCVAAAAAMLKLENPSLSPADVESRLEQYVKSIDKTSINNNNNYGSGILDLTSLIPEEYFDQINSVKEEISNLPSDISLKVLSSVETAKLHYDALSVIQKRYVDNASKLTSAVDTVDALKAAATNVLNDINSLPSTVTLDDQSTIVSLRERYDSLNEDQQALVANISKLERAEQTVDRLRQEVNNLEDEINALPSTATLLDKTTVESLRKQFNAMPSSQQAYVTNISLLIQVERQIAALLKETQDIIDAISRLSSVTLQDKAAVNALMNKYNALSPEQQDLVTNFDKLEKADQTIAYLEEKEKEEAEKAEKARKEEEARKAKYKNSRPRANVTYRVPLKKKQTTKALKVIGLAGEDKVVKMVSSDKKKATVRWNEDGTCVITAGKKTGSVTITATCACGKKATFRIKVQKKKVKTKKIQIASRKVYLSVGDKLALKPELYPVTSAQKITFISKNKSVVKVTKSGVLKAKKKGSAVIVIKSGKKKLKVKVIVN